MSESWPESVPETLWRYGQLQAQDFPQIPMMGITFEPRFLYAFGFGVLFLAVFAWVRFAERKAETGGFSYRVIKDSGVADLGGNGALRTAYLIYATTLIFIYVAMTFFGKLIIQAFNSLNVIGVQVDASSLKFDSPEWPLTLAFGLAGLAPLLPPLKVLEGWLFQRAYRAVGIPVRIYQTTRNLTDILHRASGSGNGDVLAKELGAKERALEARIAGTWVDELLQAARTSKRAHLISVLAQLELLVEWARGRRGTWPAYRDLSDTLRNLEQELSEQGEALLDRFEDRLREAHGPESLPSTNGQSSQPAAAEPASEGQGANAAGNGGAAAPAVLQPGNGAAAQDPEHAAGVLERRKEFLTKTCRDAERLRNELVAILAVYVERDSRLEASTAHAGANAIKDASLRALVARADPPNRAAPGPSSASCSACSSHSCSTPCCRGGAYIRCCRRTR